MVEGGNEFLFRKHRLAAGTVTAFRLARRSAGRLNALDGHGVMAERGKLGEHRLGAAVLALKARLARRRAGGLDGVFLAVVNGDITPMQNRTAYAIMSIFITTSIVLAETRHEILA